MTKHRDLAYGDRFPEAVIDALMEFVSTLLVNFKLSLANPVTLQVVAGAGNDQVGAGIQGRWRYIAATINAAHPGGAAANYDVFITAADNVFTPSGLPPGSPPEIDNTVYTFGLVILAVGGTPGTALYRKIAQVAWDGAKITRIIPLAGNLPVSVADLIAVLPESAARNTMQPSGDFVMQTFKRIAAGTADLTQWTDDAAALVASVSENGRIFAAGGFVLPAYTTAARDALSAARKPTRTVIWNTDNLQPEINVGTGAAPAWNPLGGYGPGIGLDFYGDERDAPARTTTCDGHQMSKATEPGLWNKLSHGGGVSPWDTFGGLPAPSAGNFRSPDLRGRGTIGKKDMGALIGTSPPTLTGAAITRAAAATLGALFGEEFHTLSIAEIPSHDHGGVTGVQSVSHTHSGTTGNPSNDWTHSGSTGGESAGHYHGYWRDLDVTFYDVEGDHGVGLWGATSDNSHYLDNTGYDSNDHYHSFTTSGVSVWHTHAFTTGNQSASHTHPVTAQGGGGAHENVFPVAVVNKLVTL